MKKNIIIGLSFSFISLLFSSCDKMITESINPDSLNYYLMNNKSKKTNFTFNADSFAFKDCTIQEENNGIKLNFVFIDDAITIYAPDNINQENFKTLYERAEWSQKNNENIRFFPIVFYPVDIKKKIYKINEFSGIESEAHYTERKKLEYLHSLDGSQMITIPGADNFEVGLTLVTQKLFKSVLPDFNLYRKHDKEIYYEEIDDDRFPVQGLSYLTAIYFCNKFSKMNGLEPVYSICGEYDEDKWGYDPFKYEPGENRKYYVTNNYLVNWLYNIMPSIIAEKCISAQKNWMAQNHISWVGDAPSLNYFLYSKEYIKVDYSKNGYRLLTTNEYFKLGSWSSFGDLKINDVECQFGEKKINNYYSKIGKIERFERWWWDENGNIIPKIVTYVDSVGRDCIDVMPVATKKPNKYGLYDAGANCGFLYCWTEKAYTNTYGLYEARLSPPNYGGEYCSPKYRCDDITRVESNATIRLAKGKRWL